jgi:hypothetical protein
MAETQGFFDQQEGSGLEPSVVDGGARRSEA